MHKRAFFPPIWLMHLAVFVSQKTKRHEEKLDGKTYQSFHSRVRESFEMQMRPNRKNVEKTSGLSHCSELNRLYGGSFSIEKVIL